MTAHSRIDSALRLAACVILASRLDTQPAVAQLTALGSAQLDQCSGPDACEAEDQFGRALAAGDFNGDGFVDLAVGVPGETTNGAGGAGLVEIYYGSISGLSGTGVIFTQESSGVPGSSETNDHFGAALAAGELDLDGFADLAIGVPDEDIGSVVDAGMVVVLFGSASGLSGAVALEYDQSNLPSRALDCSGNFTESAESGDHFGFSVAMGLAGPAATLTRLIVGAPGEDGFLPGQTDVGQVDEFIFTDWFNFPRGEYCARFQDSFGMCNGSDGVEGGDGLGWAVAGRTPLFSNPESVVGIPFEETAAGISNSGAVIENGHCLQQNGALAGGEETGDRFGGALASGDFNDDGRQDQAIGIAGESLGAADEAGAVAVVYADETDHLAAAGNQFFDQDDFQPAAASETGDHFGAALATGDFDGDGRTDLAIGAPDDDVNGHGNAGELGILYSGGASGLATSDDQAFNQDLPATIPSFAEDGDAFGSALAAGDFDGNGSADLAVGVPGESGIQAHVGVVDLLYGLRRANGAFGTVAFTTASFSVSEHSDFTFVVADREGGAVLSAAVDHARTGGTATPGVDFNYTPGTFTWTSGDLSTDIRTIDIVDDTTDEPNETLIIHLSNPSAGLAIGPIATITVTITDDDPPGQLFVDGFETGNTSKWSQAVP